MSSSSSSGAVVAVETAPSTCTWSRHDEKGQCVLEPRSCYDCLNTRPTSNESCTLTPTGVCEGAAAYDPTRDYRRMAPATAWPPSLNFFPATNSTYCEPNEPACVYCRSTTFKNWEYNRSQYCKGESGCVCVSVCENDQWEEIIQPDLKNVLETNNSSFANCTIEEVATDNATATSSGSLTDYVGVSSNKDIYSGSDDCMWVQNQTFCGVPRTCYDCLNTPLYSGNKCMLHSSGYCTSMVYYDRFKDFRKVGASNHSIALFPSTNTTYCPPSDKICTECRQNQTFAQWTGVSSPPKFCIGETGCVCVASCESPLWQSAVVNLTCDTAAVQKITSNSKTSQRLSPSAFWAVTALSVLLSLVCALLLLSFFRRFQQHRNRRQRPAPRSPRGPRLELNGWKAMREKLIETEREFVGETGTISHLSGRHLHTTSADSSDPDPEPSEGPTASVLVVEEGDAYRPLSPSRMHA